ncbi:MAG: hypothetical protein QOI73_1775 [Solirubrobacteraceae bacterium]|nr:hypothetical protein [Solirubrobacteraceae bacterium]
MMRITSPKSDIEAKKGPTVLSIITKKVHWMIAASVLVMSLAIAGPAQAGMPIVYDQSGGSVPMFVGTKASLPVEYWEPNSSQFEMNCWTDDDWYSGNYSTNRWFYGQDYATGDWGYVPASYVYYQVDVPSC